MARKLPEIPKCKSCGRQMYGGGGGLCRDCQVKRASADYQKVMRAEQSMSGSNSWLRGYSPWSAIVLVPLIVTVLILLLVVIVLISSAK